MGIIYYFLSTLDSVNCKFSGRIHAWEYATWLPDAEWEFSVLEQSIIVPRDFFVDALYCALHREAWIHVGRIYNGFTRDESSISSGIVSLFKFWKWPFDKWKKSILSSAARHQATLWTMTFYKSLAASFFSEAALLRMSQHPYHRVRSLRLTDSSPLTLASSVFVVSVWSNALYYLADLTVRQVSILLAQRKEFRWAVASIMDSEAKEKCFESSLVKSYWDTIYRQSLRLWYSSLGSAMGSAVLPGFCTLAGIGLGEQWANQQDIPCPSGPVLNAFPWLQKCFASSSTASTTPTKGGPVLQSTALLCGCCQANYFSSNPNHPTHVPISSQSCEHTICRSCVDSCQEAELQLSGATDVASSDQLAACPICDAPAAFSPNDLMVNQSLCQVISLLHRKRSVSFSAFSDPSSTGSGIGRLKEVELTQSEREISDDDTLSV